MRAVAALLVTSALSSPAFSQDYSPPGIPPIRQTIDQNGVDVTRGTIIAGAHSVSIGPPAAAGMSWSRTVTGGVSYFDSTAITISVSGTTYTVSIGGSSESFTLTGGYYVPGQGTGSTLTLSGTTFTYTSKDGAVYTFVPVTGDQQYSGGYHVSTVTRPTGEIETFNWENVSGICHWNEKYMICTRVNGQRLRSVTSTNGYRLAFTFLTEDPSTSEGPTPGWASIATVQAQNMSVDPASQSWPTLTFTGQVFFSSAVTIADSLSHATTYTYTADGSGYYPTLWKVQRPGASSPNKIIGWNTSGLVGSVLNNGVTDTYTYSTAGSVLTTTVTDPNSHTRVITTDTTTGLVSSDTDELGKTTSYTYYSGTGLLHTVTAPEGNYVTYGYDQRSNLTDTTSTPKAGSGLSPLSTAVHYPASDGTHSWMCPTGTPAVTCNKPTDSVDAKGQTTNYTWSTTSGLPLTVTPPAPATGAPQPQTRYTYTSVYGQYLSGSSLVNFSTPVTRLSTISECQTQDYSSNPCAGQADEVKTSVAYTRTGVTNTNALPLTVTKGAGDGSLSATNTYSWDLIGNKVLLDGPMNDDVTTWYYDADRQLIGTAGIGPYTAKNRAQRFTYNPDGQVTKVEAGTVPNESASGFASFTSLAEVDTGYDANARPTTQKLVSGTTTYALTQTTYDNMGRVDCSAVRMNSAIYSSLPTSACTVGTLGSYGQDRITKTGYDWNSRPLTVTTAYGLADQAVTATVTYSNNGKVTSLKDGQNNTTNYTLDGFDRLKTTTYPDTKTEQLTYDNNSNIATFTTRNSELISFNYDNLNRRTSLGSSVLADRSYTYDLLNRPKTATFNSGQGISNSFDALSRLTASLTNVGGTSRTMSYQYDLAGHRTIVMWWDGFYVNTDRLTTGEISAVRENGAVTTPGILESYTYNDFGEPIADARGNGTSISWSYDLAGRFTGITNHYNGGVNDLTITNTLNPASQISSQFRSNDAYSWTATAGGKSYVPNNLNQYSSVSGTTYQYDANGNLYKDGTNTWNFDALNRLISSSTTATGGVSTAETYDPLDRLDTYTAGSTTVRGIYDGDEMVAELDSSGNIIGRFIRGDSPDELLVSYSSSATTSKQWAHLDERNSVIAFSDGSGNASSLNRYDEFGRPQTTNTGLFQYTGQMWLSGAVLQYSKAREYSPTLGRFLQMDPVGVNGGINLYNYTDNDPVNAIDPSGLDAAIGQVINCIGWEFCGPMTITGGQCSDFATCYRDPGNQLIYTPNFPQPPSDPDGGGPVIGRGSTRIVVRTGRSATRNSCHSSAPVADEIAAIADLAATGLAIGAAASSETVVGGVSLGVLAGTAKAISLGANAYSAYENRIAGNRMRAGAIVAASAIGLVGGKPVELIGSAAERRGVQLAMSPAAIKGMSEGTGYGTGEVAGLVICP